MDAQPTTGRDPNRFSHASHAVRAYTTWLVLATVALAACGNDGEGGDGDTLFTGLSGVVILALVIYFITRKMRRRD